MSNDDKDDDSGAAGEVDEAQNKINDDDNGSGEVIDAAGEVDEAQNKINDDDNSSVEVIDVESGDDDDKDDDIDDKQIHSAIFIQRKEISAKFLEGTAGMTNSKFIAHQKLNGPTVGPYFFAATFIGQGEDIFLIEYGDMFEGLLLLTCAYSEVLDDIQCVFVKHSWLEQCPEMDESNGNHASVKGYC